MSDRGRPDETGAQFAIAASPVVIPAATQPEASANPPAVPVALGAPSHTRDAPTAELPLIVATVTVELEGEASAPLAPIPEHTQQVTPAELKELLANGQPPAPVSNPEATQEVPAPSRAQLLGQPVKLETGVAPLGGDSTDVMLQRLVIQPLPIARPPAPELTAATLDLRPGWKQALAKLESGAAPEPAAVAPEPSAVILGADGLALGAPPTRVLRAFATEPAPAPEPIAAEPAAPPPPAAIESAARGAPAATGLGPTVNVPVVVLVAAALTLVMGTWLITRQTQPRPPAAEEALAPAAVALESRRPPAVPVPEVAPAVPAAPVAAAPDPKTQSPHPPAPAAVAHPKPAHHEKPARATRGPK